MTERPGAARLDSRRSRSTAPTVAAVAFAALLGLAAGASAGVAPSGPGPWVVRAFLGSDAMIREVASWADHIGVYPEKGFILVAVDEAGRRRLAEAGFHLEVDEERTARLHLPSTAAPGGAGIPGFPCYRTVEETYDVAAGLALAHPGLASWIDIGDTWEKVTFPGQGYDMRVLRLTNAAIPGPKPTLFVTTGIHAREYATAELGTRLAEHLVARYGEDPDVTWLLDHHAVHLVLHTNPDGRKRAELGQLWRKNANNNYCSNSGNRGADLNRNFDFEWGNRQGSSGNACAETYRGAAAGSEPEVQAVQAQLAAIFPDQRPDDLVTPAPANATGIYVDIHSFSPRVLTPFGFSPPNCNFGPAAPNAAGLLTLGRKYAFFSHYDALQGSLYCVDGDTMDFGYGRLGVASLAIEVGTDFFQDCPYFEATLLPDNLDALLYLARVARTPYQTPAGPESVGVALPPQAFAAGDVVPLAATVDDTRYRGAEPTQAVAAAEAYLGLPPWDAAASALPLAAADGAFNSPVEAVEGSLDTSGLAPGRHLVFVRGRDLPGSWGAVSAAFLHVIDPAVAPTLEGVVRDGQTNQPLAATVRAGSLETTSDGATGAYSMQVPSGTYDLTAEAPGHAPRTFAAVVAGDFQTVVTDFALTPYEIVLADDVEGGNLGWTAQPPWAITTQLAASPTHSWTDSPGGSYADNANVSLTSPVLDLSGLAGVTLTFRHRYDLESGFDYGYVEFSTNGGASWSAPAAAFSGTQTAGWPEVVLALPALDGVATARVRFRLDADPFLTADGWYVDDVMLRAVPTGPPPFIFADGFEAGDFSAWSAAVP